MTSKKIKGIFKVLCLASVLTITSCSNNKTASDSIVKDGTTGEGYSKTSADSSYTTTDDEKTPSSGSVSLTDKTSDYDSYDFSAINKAEDFSFDGFVSDSVSSESFSSDSAYSKEVGSSSPYEEYPEVPSPYEEYPMQTPQAGLLTCGEWNDNKNFGFFANLITSNRFTFKAFGINSMHRVAVTVTDTFGTPLYNAKVTLNAMSNNNNEYFPVYSAVTNKNGICYLFYNIDDSDTFTVNKDNLNITVSYYGNELIGTLEINDSESIDTVSSDVQSNEQLDLQNNNIYTVNNISAKFTTEFKDTYDITTTPLDVMFVFDTTGSMGDELIYLQTEFKDIASKVSKYNPRFSINFYRDEGDDYILKSNPFTSDYQLCSSLINAEAADGGGDYPEAVDAALEDAITNHEWKEDAVKILFLILDAPPHNGTDATFQQIIPDAAKKGIRIIPVASSGVDEETEAFLRICSMLTGGTYTFLTDDSGVGGSHLEPTIGSYDVENLNKCIVRLIEEFYLGEQNNNSNIDNSTNDNNTNNTNDNSTNNNSDDNNNTNNNSNAG